MELIESFRTLLYQFDPVFTAPTFNTFAFIVTGWILSHRHRYVTEIIFSSGRVGVGHWSRFHRFFSHAAWDLGRLVFALAMDQDKAAAQMAATLADTLRPVRGSTASGITTQNPEVKALTIS